MYISAKKAGQEERMGCSSPNSCSWEAMETHGEVMWFLGMQRAQCYYVNVLFLSLPHSCSRRFTELTAAEQGVVWSFCKKTIKWMTAFSLCFKKMKN